MSVNHVQHDFLPDKVIIIIMVSNTLYILNITIRIKEIINIMSFFLTINFHGLIISADLKRKVQLDEKKILFHICPDNSAFINPLSHVM